MGPYNLCHNNSFKRRRIDSVWNGNGLVSYLDPSSSVGFNAQLNKRIEVSQCFEIENQKIPAECPCRICKINLGKIRLIITYKN